MSDYDLDKLYQNGYFKEGHSRKADEAIAKLMGILREKHSSGGDFETAWQELLKVLVLEFPNISAYNLVGLHLPLITRGLNQENLLIYRFAVELNPQSGEIQCFLGHAYKHVGDLESTAVCYRHAYDIALGRIAEHEFEVSHPMYLDVCDYLCYLAEAENDLRRRADAFVHATQALNILKKANATFKEDWVYEVLHRICLGMNLADLTEHYRIQAEKAKKEHPFI